MKKKLVDLLARLQRLEMDAQAVLAAVPGRIAQTEMPDLVDAGFCARECSKICDTLRKAFTARQEVVGRYLAAFAGSEALKGIDVKLEGELAFGTPDVSTKPKMPMNGTKEYTALMRWLGVPDALIERDVLRPSFTALQAELTRRLATGEKPPPGIVTTYNDMLVVFRKKRGNKDGTEE